MAKPEWIAVSPDTGIGNRQVNISAQEHTGRGSRAYTLTAQTSHGENAECVVTQSGASEFIRFTQYPESVNPEDETFTIYGESNSPVLTVQFIPSGLEVVMLEANGANLGTDGGEVPGDPGQGGKYVFSMSFKFTTAAGTADEDLQIGVAGYSTANMVIVTRKGFPLYVESPAAIEAPAAGLFQFTTDEAVFQVADGGGYVVSLGARPGWIQQVKIRFIYTLSGGETETGAWKDFSSTVMDAGTPGKAPRGYQLQMQITPNSGATTRSGAIRLEFRTPQGYIRDVSVPVEQAAHEVLAAFSNTLLTVTDGQRADFIAICHGIERMTLSGSMSYTVTAYGSTSIASGYLTSDDPSWTELAQTSATGWDVGQEIRHLKLSVSYGAGMPSPMDGTFSFYGASGQTVEQILTIERGGSAGSTYQLRVTSAGDNKTQVIKTLSEMTGMRLAEAKSVVDNAEWFGEFQDYEATDIQAALQDLGATVESRQTP